MQRASMMRAMAQAPTPLIDLPTWRAESGAPAPRRVVMADDTLTADAAYRLACEGTGLLWQGDFHNARQLLQALARRVDRKPTKKSKAPPPDVTPAQAFHLHRQAQGQRARTLAMVLVPMNGDYTIPLRRAPDLREACTEAWGPAQGEACMVSLRELLGLVGAHEWHKKGVEIPALGEAPQNRIHPHYGVFSPVRGEYVDLVNTTPIADKSLAFDIGVGTGVLSAVLAQRGVQRIVATDQDPRALACAQDNLQRLQRLNKVSLIQCDCFQKVAHHWWCVTRRGCLRAQAHRLSMRCMTKAAACCVAFCRGCVNTSALKAKAG